MPITLTGNIDVRDYAALVRYWCKGRLSPRAEFYSGRGVNPGDLDHNHLKMLYDGIKSDIGADEAQNFCLFVDNLDDMSASAFLLALEGFVYSGFKKTNPSQGDNDWMAIGSDDGTGSREVAAQASIFSAMMFGGGHSDPAQRSMAGESIKQPFFQSVGYKQTRQPVYDMWTGRRNDGYDDRFYCALTEDFDDDYAIAHAEKREKLGYQKMRLMRKRGRA